MEIEDKKKYCNEDAFAEDIFDEIFRCPATESKIDNIYDFNTWAATKDDTPTPPVDFDSKEETCKYLGAPQAKYPISKGQSGYRIRKMTNVGNGWSCYYENINDKSGCHDFDYNDPSAFVDFDRAIVLYRNGPNL